MSKNIVIGVIVFSVLVVVGGYFLANQGKSATTKAVSYSKSDQDKPRIEVKETLLDIGKMKVSEQKSVEFAIKNSGQKPLQLFDISSSCGCTVAQVVIDGQESAEFGMHGQSDYIGEIGPGGEAKLKVTYRPYVMPVYGSVGREVYVSTNDPDKPKLTFQVKAFVE